jgi:hypothetical protein
MAIDHHILALETLNLTAAATFEDAKAAYKKSRKELHPDQYMDKPHLKAVAEEALKKVNDAWDFLKKNPWSGKYLSTPHATAKKRLLAMITALTATATTIFRLTIFVTERTSISCLRSCLQIQFWSVTATSMLWPMSSTMRR